MYTIEFQKRGLPHAHILLWLTEGNVMPTTKEIDRIISAEIPDRNLDPEAYEQVEQHMMHGPCGADRASSPCMQKGECSKNYPKKYVPLTKVDDKGFISYRRREDGRFVKKGSTKLDNRYVVPHNVEILKKYKAHINVEWCSKTSAIKYLFKYITKGVDRATTVIQQGRSGENNDNKGEKASKRRNEITEYLDCRYLSACESMWRIFAFDIHHHNPAVMKLPVHLEGEQTAVFEQDEDLENVTYRYGHGRTMLTEWFELCKMYPDARKMKYIEIPKYFVWDKSNKMFFRRKVRGNIGRIVNIHPSSGDKYYLRILVNTVTGPTCFDDLKRVGGVLHKSFQAACYARGLLEEDKEWHQIMDQAAQWSSPYMLRILFVMLLIYCQVSEPVRLWEHCWIKMAEDQLKKQRKAMNFPKLELSEIQLKEYTLNDIEVEFREHGRSLTDFKDMPKPNKTVLDELNNKQENEESKFNVGEETALHETLLPKLNVEQRRIYDEVMESVIGKKGNYSLSMVLAELGKLFCTRRLYQR